MFHEFIPRFTLTRTSALPLMSLPHGLLRCGFWLPAPPPITKDTPATSQCGKIGFGSDILRRRSYGVLGTILDLIDQLLHFACVWRVGLGLARNHRARLQSSGDSHGFSSKTNSSELSARL